MTSQVCHSWRRCIYLWLTTSSRSRYNRTDDVGTFLQAARRERNKVQSINDLFHTCGRQHHHCDTLEGITLQGRGEGLAWGFMMIPACFTLTFIASITLYRWGDRLAVQKHTQEEWQHCLLEASQNRAAADEELQSVHQRTVEMRAALRPLPGEQQWSAQLESNMLFINEKLQRHSPDDEPPRGSR
ncbi:conserved hypothetical protein [Leishmania braziliensis MHOM/BR/75/M2904]|uniref:Uncharacterized protein n=1 Tax=Leishmania braziliensis TaxID=5660 RepID=A4HCN8_LEIBR|nr:conserved hypothetical protein [Leishmania braziliensis MHOM/BR/75/M2904]KAI5688453.1 hypothetical protein MNV84_03920 [Leishmania braziliensis]CAJ2473106.1 unnamed protein product [Leishmania braziliensis]CAM36533.2 conserved hypothetical protein [Leishmania braziliensis MHOM/BR/75/M2904]